MRDFRLEPAFRPLPRRRLAAAAVALLAGGVLLLLPAGAQERAPAEEGVAGGAPAPAPDQPRPRVVRARIDSVIHPVAAQFLVESLEEADASRADLFVLELDTPGGLSTSMHEMVTAILNARTPVVVYVSPSGAQAASAGFFLLMASDVAAMAPGTNTGAAAAVGPQGAELEDTLKAKAQEDGASKIRSLAERHGRNVELAELAVTEARAYSAEEALREGLVELLAPDLDTLLGELDGREIAGAEGETVTLRTAGAELVQSEMTLFQRLLAVVADPTIAYLLLSLGGLGLTLELYNPGSIFPGVVGAICILLAFFGLSVLPVNYAGVAFVLLAIVLFIAEIKVASYGLLTAGGITCLVLGGLMLIKSPEPALQVSIRAIVSLAVFSLLAVGLLASLVVRAHKRQVATGSEGLLHERGEARSAIDPRGKVFVHGELWNALADTPIAAGDPVEVVGVDRLTLKVRRLSGTSGAGTA